MPAAGDRHFLLTFCCRLDKKWGVWQDATCRFWIDLLIKADVISNAERDLHLKTDFSPWSKWQEQDCRVSARQPSSFSLAEPQSKRTKRNGSLAVGMMAAEFSGSIRSRSKEIELYLRREERRGPMDSAPIACVNCHLDRRRDLLSLSNISIF